MIATKSTPPGLTPPTPLADVSVLRKRILATILKGCSGIGLAAYVLVAFNLYPRHLWGILGLYTLGYLWLLAITFVHRISYSVRVISFLSILYLIGIGGLLDSGLSGDGKAFLLVFASMACLFLGLRAGSIALGLIIATLSVIGWGMSAGVIPLPPLETMANSGTPTEWAASVIIILLVGLIIVAAMAAIFQGLTQSLDQSQILLLQMEKQQAGLEDTIRQSTGKLEYRLVQLHTAAEISQTISADLIPQNLLNQVVDLIQSRFDLYYVGAFILDEQGKFAVLRAGTGDAGAKMLAVDHKLEVGNQSMIGWSILNRKARIALDVGLDAVRFNNPYLPLTHSEMALPLVARDKVVGALTIQSTISGAFDQDDIVVLQGIANILATSIENGRLFQQTQESLDEIEALHRQYLVGAWTETGHSAGNLQSSYEIPSTHSLEHTQTIEIPMLLREQVLGKVTLETGDQGLDADDFALIDAITTQTALALENARLLEETQRRASQEQALNEMSLQFSRALRVDDILKIAIQELGQLPSVAEVSVFLETPGDPITPAPSN